LWTEALHFIVWVKNRTLTRVLGNITPFERLTGQKPNIAGVPEWEQKVWVHTTANSKLDVQAVIAHWVGYDGDSTHAHWIYWPEQRKVSVECDVQFTAGSTSITIHLSLPLPAPSVPALTAPSTTPAADTTMPSIPTQATSAPQQPPAATSSGEEEIEVEDELSNTPPLPASDSEEVCDIAAQRTQEGKA